MASTQAPAISERADIHKSCKSLETLLSVFNDYCEAAGAIVLIQKKLAKALKETATLKVTGQIAANTLSASANIFEASSDIDAKFAKHVDKEYDTVSAEVKKWFKKLAKEEKAHDERILAANARIKQAGQNYEKKSKKNARDVGDEHARYIQLISSLGPEISQEKYNHALLVTERHGSTTQSVAASIARVADSEWLRSCESVRRFSPTIGQLGEWRSLCEGGWTGPVPQDLPDPDPKPRDPQHLEHPTPVRFDTETSLNYRNVTPQTEEPPTNAVPSGTLSPFPEAHEIPPSSPQPQQRPPPSPTSSKPPPSSFEPPRAHVDPTTGSVRSLSAFPSPPTHFPPAMSHRQSSQGYSSHSSSTSQVSFPTTRTRSYDTRLTHGDEPPLEEEPLMESPVSRDPSANNSPEQKFKEVNLQKIALEQNSAKGMQTSADMIKPEPAFNDREFGANHPPPRGTDSPQSVTTVKRTDSTSSNSVVTAMRNRYSHTTGGSSSPPPKDIPRLPISVNRIASRYQAPDSPTSPRAGSPTSARALPPIDPIAYAREAEASWRTPIEEQPPQPDRHLALKEKEEQLREREREIEQRAFQLERERENMENSRVMSPDGARPRNGLSPRHPSQPQGHALRPRERSLSFQQAQLQRPVYSNANSASTTDLMQSSSPPQMHRPASSYSSNNGRLGPPSSGQAPRRGEDLNDSGSPTDHAPYCGCERCSATKYRTPTASPTPSTMSPPSPQRPYTNHLRPAAPEKPKGWMRRLSMPIVVSNAFSDGKKSSSSGKLGISSMDSRKNGSTTMLRGSITEEGRISPGAAGIGAGGGRRSYDVSGYSNRSSTNLHHR